MLNRESTFPERRRAGMNRVDLQGYLRGERRTGAIPGHQADEFIGFADRNPDQRELVRLRQDPADAGEQPAPVVGPDQGGAHLVDERQQPDQFR